MIFRPYRHRPARRDPAVIAAEKAAADAKAMTCQCCDRRIFAETGLIAHHGYERPEAGWQTASCVGARRLPWEVDHAALDQLITNLGAYIEKLGVQIERTEAEELPVPYTFCDYTRPNPRRYRPYTERTEWVTRDSFAQVRAEARQVERHRQAVEPTFDALKERKLRSLRGELQRAQEWLANRQARRAGWKQTHRAGGPGERTWEAL